MRGIRVRSLVLWAAVFGMAGGGTALQAVGPRECRVNGQGRIELRGGNLSRTKNGPWLEVRDPALAEAIWKEMGCMGY